MIRLISFVGTLTEIGIGVGIVTFPSKRPMWGEYVFFMANSQSFFICFTFSVIISRGSASFFIEMVMLLVWNAPWLKQECGLVGWLYPVLGAHERQICLCYDKIPKFL